jgi:signal transduction histidine kinase
VGKSERIAQVLANLLSNATEYSPAGSSIEVDARSFDGTVRVEVRDYGLRIPRDQQARCSTSSSASTPPRRNSFGSSARPSRRG